MKSIPLALTTLGCTQRVRHASSLSTAFDVQKARLMARFSYAAYEDPPPSMRALRIDRLDGERSSGSGVASNDFGVERRTDEFGVAVTRPVNNGGEIASTDEQSVWEMSHVNACSPRSLNLMLSECTPTSTPQDEGLDMENATFRWVGLASNEKTGAQFDAWKITANPNLASGEKKKSQTILAIAFRGTRLDTSVDLLTDIQLQQEMVSCSDFTCTFVEDSDDTVPAPSPSDSNYLSSVDEIMVHSGFLKAYTSIRPTLFRLIEDNSDDVDTIWMTGHSLGGALATLAVADVGSVMNSVSPTTVVGDGVVVSIPKLQISSYVFGTPRVGNAALAQRLRQLQQSARHVVREYFRVNTAGDAVVFLPRGKNVNRLGIDYVHAGSTVILPSLLPSRSESGSNRQPRQMPTENNISSRMMRLEEEVIEQINNYVFRSYNKDIGTETKSLHKQKESLGTKIKVYQNSDSPPDPLSEINPDYEGFFPVDPRIWTTPSFRNFVLGEVVRSFRVLRGGFNSGHRLVNYERVLCSVSQDDVVVII